MLQIGEAIPDIKLDAYYENKEKKMNLSDYKGKWLLILFYPADFTFVCPTELGEAAAHYKEFQSVNAEIVSVSTDTIWVHKAWHDQSPIIKTVDFPMLSDPTGNMCKIFGTYIEAEGLSRRASFIFDPEGVLKSYEVHDNSIGRNINELFRKLQASQFVREHNGEVCPASWKPGEKTIKKGLHLVGKI